MLLPSPARGKARLGASAVTSRTKPRLGITPLAGKAAAIFLVCLCVAFAQSDANPASAPQQSPPSNTASVAPTDKNSAEVASHDAPTAFKVSVRLVLMRAVVRDANGRAIGTFGKDDFQLYDNGKPQVIKHFAVEQSSTPAKPPESPTQPGQTATATVVPPPQVPDRFVIYLFDDVHLQSKDLLPARAAAERHLATLRPTDRAAVFATSGQGNLDFTDDRAKLHEALMRIQPRPILNLGTAQCPYMTYYMADQIINLHDQDILNVAAQDTVNCGGLSTAAPQLAAASEQAAMQQAAIQQASSAAQQAYSLGDAESRLVLEALKDTVRRISVTPGLRTLVLVSPGFITPTLEDKVSDIIEKAVRNNVTISALDARGLYTLDAVDEISQQGAANPLLLQQEFMYATSSDTSNQLVLSELADATGGIYFHNNNDLDEGFRRVASVPEYSYVIGFSPQNLKLDGHYHKLKLSLRDPQNFTIQARRGYYAPKHILDPAEQEKQEIEEALFSHDELHDIPIELHTQFFKSSSDNAKLTVVAHVDVKGLHFRKVDGRNRDDLTIVSGLFNRNGDFIQGSKKILEMRLKDDTLEHKLGSGISMRTSFDVKPGGYLVRLVVRDAEDRMMSAQSGAVEIP
ncbi:MAG TPA: VWA domain-containing protein [Terriglobales bacterium]|jgi:VWFA-related protein|nr:VWA domain-containing protein [Terriglobales bacterium]